MISFSCKCFVLLFFHLSHKETELWIMSVRYWNRVYSMDNRSSVQNILVRWQIWSFKTNCHTKQMKYISLCSLIHVKIQWKLRDDNLRIKFWTKILVCLSLMWTCISRNLMTVIRKQRESWPHLLLQLHHFCLQYSITDVCLGGYSFKGRDLILLFPNWYSSMLLEVTDSNWYTITMIGEVLPPDIFRDWAEVVRW